MADEDIKRKLAAIFSADAVGYSRLMGEDEEATIQTLTEYREVITAQVKQCQGRVVDSPGDNVLSEFASVVDAVRCAVHTQKEIAELNSRLPESRRMLFRIGVNLGDIVEKDDRIYGDGVNIAARLESLAEGGGICISRTAFDQLKGKLDVGYQYLGEHSVKNIEEPVRVYKVLMEPQAAGKVIGEKPARRGWPRPAIVSVVLLGIVLAGVAVWYAYFQRTVHLEQASLDKMALPLPDKPSIAVLPFVNLSDDPKQEYFSDGMTDDLITDLSKISGLLVISRNSTFTYKGQPVKIQKVAQELNVRYVLEGSVRKAGEQVRINAQLIDATTGHHLWAERYDDKIGNIFALQDKITGKIVAALAVKFSEGEHEQIARKYTGNIAAYDLFLQGWAHYIRRTPDDYIKAVQYFEKAIELDPNYGRAHAALSSTYQESFYALWDLGPNVPWMQTRNLAEKYLQTAMQNPTPLAHQVASKIHIDKFEHDEAIANAERSIALDPNDANSYVAMAYALIYAGRPEEAVDFVKKAMLIDPHYPAYYLFVLGMVQFGKDQFEEAAALFERALSRNPENYVPLIPLSATYAHLNRHQDAEAAIAKLRKINPMMTMPLIRECPLWKFKDPEDKTRLLNGLRKAGLPDSVYDILRKGS